ncbi:MAG: hypothetical protein LJE75_10895 [Gammaproteobacteria bacterium]|nr:hypothetical protein [Gammaproteobacteria bacterium]
MTTTRRQAGDRLALIPRLVVTVAISVAQSKMAHCPGLLLVRGRPPQPSSSQGRKKFFIAWSTGPVGRYQDYTCWLPRVRWFLSLH